MPSPEMDAVAEAFAGPFPLDPEGGRAAYDALGEANPPDPETRWEATDVGGIGGPLSEWQWWDGVGDDRVVLYLHGGGYVVGSPPTWRCFAGRLSREANVRLLNFDYRLAPEHPFPAAIDDAVAAYRWLLKEGFEPQQIALGGDSAGGALGITVMTVLRDSGDPLPAAHMALCPWADATNGASSLDDPSVGDPNPDLRTLAEAMAANFLQGADPTDPLASPLRRTHRPAPRPGRDLRPRRHPRGRPPPRRRPRRRGSRGHRRRVRRRHPRLPHVRPPHP